MVYLLTVDKELSKWSEKDQRTRRWFAQHEAALRISEHGLAVKYEEVYLHAYVSVSEARTSIGRYLGFYNGMRPHQSLGRQTPDQAYSNALQPIPAAA